MILAAWGIAAVGALLGTRLTAIPLVGAGLLAVTSARGAVTGAIGLSVALLGAVVVASSRSPRRYALPLVGAASTLLVASSTNAALVVPPLLLATASAVAATGHGARQRRWSVALVASDVPVVAAVVWTVWMQGFVSWPPATVVPVVCLSAAALWKGFLVAGPRDAVRDVALLVVRSQALVLVALPVAMPSQAGRGVALGAAAVFAAAVLLRRASAVDGLQEVALFAVATAGAHAGWFPDAWTWIVVAAGTLVHVLRLLPAPAPAWRDAADALVQGSVGSPVLVPVAGLAVAGARAPDAPAALAVIALVLGLAGRFGVRRRARSDDDASPVVPAAAFGVATAAGVAALAWPFPTSTLAGAPGVRWWVLLPVGLGAICAVWERGVVPERPRRRRRASVRSRWLDRLSTVTPPGFLRPSLLVLTASAAAVVWFAGWSRGFL